MDGLDAIRARDAKAQDCAVCRYDADFSWHRPASECAPPADYADGPSCVNPTDHHSYVKGEPADEAEADRRFLLDNLDAVRDTSLTELGAQAETIVGLMEELRRYETALDRTAEPDYEPSGRVSRKWWRLGWLSCHAVIKALARDEPPLGVQIDLPAEEA
jgi:hypothetical protein